MRQHLLQIDHVGVPSPNVTQVTGMSLLVLISATVGADGPEACRKPSTIEARTPDVAPGDDRRIDAVLN